jgi:glycosyltransferase involved in cell wall biosynthesis
MAPGQSFDHFIKSNTAVLVPTYNNMQTLGAVLDAVLTYTDRIIVVNDGSTDGTSDILARYPQIDVVSYHPNRGKGYALRQGFARAHARGLASIITIDSDGQHFAEDLPKFLQQNDRHPGAIIMGVRNMTQADIPGKSSFGHKFSNFWFWVETGLRLGDTQSGYRLYPLAPLDHVRFLTRKFEFEIEVLVRLAWRGVPFTEVPVRIYYAPRESRISHFRPFRDFTRISILNTILVAIALLYIKPRDFFRGLKKKELPATWRKALLNADESDGVKALSVGFGIFMGIVPLWGFQLLIAIPIAFVARLNKLLVIIAANISIPPMIPLILYLSHRTGTLWMGRNARSLSFSEKITFESVQHHSLQYALGAVTLATGAGILSGGITYLALKIRRRLGSKK